MTAYSIVSLFYCFIERYLTYSGKIVQCLAMFHAVPAWNRQVAGAQKFIIVRTVLKMNVNKMG